MARSYLWFTAQRIRLTTSDTWTLPNVQWADCGDHASAYLLLSLDAVAGGGTLTFILETAPFATADAAAWSTVASGTINARGGLTLIADEFDTTPIMGVLRVRVTCATATTTFNVRAELLLKRQVESRLYEVWLPPTPMNFAGSGTFTQVADQWLDSSRLVWAYGLARYYYGGTGTSTNLTVRLQTAIDVSAPEALWETVGAGNVNESTNNVVFISGSATPVQGILRLQASAAGALSGTLQVGVLLKDT